MHELGTELGRFIGGSIDGTQLRAAFNEYLSAHPDRRSEVADWLKDSVQSGRLSASVWLSLRDLFDVPPLHDAGVATRLTEKISGRRQTDSPEVTAERAYQPQAPASRSAAKNVPPLGTGMVVRERFVLMEELGSGGMGKVFKARDLRREEAQDRNPFVALKILKAEISAHPDAFMALQREARRAGTLAHPNVVTVYDFDRDGDRIYMTMEYLEGRPLDSWLRLEYANGIPLKDAWPIINAVGAALDCGHQKRIVHSDLKPGNIFVCADGIVKVLDFGISRLIRPTDGKTDETIFDPGKRLGGLTPAYASLEMWTHDTPDPRDDIYALACVSYELLTGKHPFNRASARDVRDKKLTPARIKSLNRMQWEALRRGLALRRSERTATVRRFLDDLRPRSAWQRSAKPLTAAGVVLVVAGVVIGAQYYRTAVEDSTMEGLCAQIIKPESAVAKNSAVLTPEIKREIADNMELAADYLGEATPDMPVDELKAILSDAPNSVNYILDKVLEADPAHKQALKLKSAVADIYATRAQRSLAQQRTGEALDLVRHGREVLPSSTDLFRLEQKICRADALVKSPKP